MGYFILPYLGNLAVNLLKENGIVLEGKKYAKLHNFFLFYTVLCLYLRIDLMSSEKELNASLLAF